jgi:hypothetical protein
MRKNGALGGSFQKYQQFKLFVNKLLLFQLVLEQLYVLSTAAAECICMSLPHFMMEPYADVFAQGTVLLKYERSPQMSPVEAATMPAPGYFAWSFPRSTSLHAP